MGSAEGIGTCHTHLARWAEEHLPVASHGEGTYPGGLAIANVINPHSGKGHFVILLGQRAGQVHYYCPFLGQAVIVQADAMDWQNGSRTLHRWSVNFVTRGDFYDLVVVGEGV